MLVRPSVIGGSNMLVNFNGGRETVRGFKAGSGCHQHSAIVTERQNQLGSTGAHHLDDEGGSAGNHRQEQRGLAASIPRGLFKNYRIEISCFHQTRPFGESSFRLGLQKL